MKLRSIIILLFFLFLFSCNDSDIGIFYGLKNEEKIKDRSLPNDVTVGSMVKLGMTLYIGAGNVYTKTSQSDEEWRAVAAPSGFDLSLNLVANDTNLYAIYYTKNSANKRFFRLNGDTWEQISTPGLTGTLEQVKTADNKIFISTRVNSNNAKLYYYDGISTFTEIISNMIASTFDVIYAGGNYWICNNHRIFRSNVPNNPFTPIYALDEQHDIKALMELNNNIFFTYENRRNSNGYLEVINSAGNRINGDNIGSFKLNGLKLFTVSGYQFLLCGTSGSGYYQLLNPSESNINLKRPTGRGSPISENYNSAIDLQNAVVLDFFIDRSGIDDEGDLYALTATRGLWKNSLSGGFRNWSIE